MEFHIYGGIHISGLASDKKMGILLECAEYAYIAIMKKQLKQTFSRVKIVTLIIQRRERELRFTLSPYRNYTVNLKWL